LRPTFVIIGAQKSATSPLAGFLEQHPLICIARGKETDYFSFMHPQGEAWYMAHFPTLRASRFAAWLYQLRHGGSAKAIAGDASPSYLEHPLAPARCHAFDPDMKIIVVLRDPAARAYSGYQHSLKKGYIKGDFEHAIDSEIKNDYYAQAVDAVSRGDEDAYKRLHRKLILERSLYAKHIRRWMRLFPREQFHVVQQRDLKHAPQATYDAVLSFLGVPRCSGIDFAHAGKRRSVLEDWLRSAAKRLMRRPQVARYPEMSATVRQRLEAYFRESERDLAALLRHE
jgi:hypothetical protein